MAKGTQFRNKLHSAFRVFLGLDSKQKLTDSAKDTNAKDFARNYTLSYVSVLLGGGIALSFGLVRDEVWFVEPTPSMLLSHLIEILTLVWVYFSALLSGWGTYGSAKVHPILSEKRFFCTWAILIFYFPSFLKFRDLATELFLQIPIFGLFIIWDLLKEREYYAERTEMRPRTLITVNWAVIFTLTYGLYRFVILFGNPSTVDYSFLVFVFIAMRLYRVNKEHPKGWNLLPKLTKLL